MVTLYQKTDPELQKTPLPIGRQAFGYQKNGYFIFPYKKPPHF
jgi:hypothetical protein